MLGAVQKKYYALIKPLVISYLNKPRLYSYGDLKLKIYPGVFHPGFFFSTGIMAEMVKALDLKNKSVCEIGAGSGLLSFLSARNGGIVTASDINPDAVRGMRENALTNRIRNINVYESDVLNAVPKTVFDVVLINPPWFFRERNGTGSLAWYCGVNGEFFKTLFSQLKEYTAPQSEIYMILAENAEIERIKEIGAENGWNMNVYKEEKKKWEKNYIFKLSTK